MNLKQLKAVRKYATGTYERPEDTAHPLDYIDREIAEQSRPVTAEALKASGWVLKKTHDDIFPIDEFKMGGVTARIGGGVVIVGVDRRRFDGVESMHDLGELMRLLRGAP